MYVFIPIKFNVSCPSTLEFVAIPWSMVDVIKVHALKEKDTPIPPPPAAAVAPQLGVALPACFPLFAVIFVWLECTQVLYLLS